MRRKVRAVSLLAAALALGGAAVLGDVVELPLNCAGYYDINTPAWSYDFDLGVTFSEISHVYIDWSGDITAALHVFWGAGLPPEPAPGYLRAYVGGLGRKAEVWGGVSTYPVAEPFEARSEFQLYNGSTWDGLLDGRETITVYYPRLDPWIPEIGVLDYGAASVDHATLVVEGTTVPEPATLVLFGFGILAGVRIRGHS